MEKGKISHKQIIQSMRCEIDLNIQKASELVYAFNQCNPKDHKKMHDILISLLSKLGKNYHINRPFYCDYGFNIEIGDYFFSNYNLTILDCAP